MSEGDRRRWDRKWLERSDSAAVSRLLRQHRGMLTSGRALDLACGRGQNSIWLASRGYTTMGVDISRVALARARANAVRRGVWRHTLFVEADLDRWRPGRSSVDLVVIFRFLERELHDPVKAAVRPGGLLFFETRHTGICRRMPGANRAYLLRPGELRDAFAEWSIVYYEEGEENAALIARRPPG